MSRAYAYKTTSAYLSSSTSGGACSQIIDNFYKKGNGAVYGVVFDVDSNIRHKRASTQEECDSFRKSKYVRSDMSDIYRQVLEDINNGLRVLFIGTPCQIYVLNKYLGTKGVNEDALVTVDLICNGAPSHSVWVDYKNWLEDYYKKKLAYFGFREKGDKNNPYLTKAIFTDGFTLVDSPKTACYNRLFLKKLIIPRGCFNCPFKKEERISDITLGDFWGAEQVFHHPYLKSEVSLVLVNTQKGEQLFGPELLNGDDSILVESNNKEYLEFQKNLVSPTNFPSNYEEFWEDYKRVGIGYVLNKYADACFPLSIKYSLRKLLRKIKSM